MPWPVMVGALMAAGLGIYGLVVLWRTRTTLREESMWVAMGIMVWTGVVLLGLGAFVLVANFISYVTTPSPVTQPRAVSRSTVSGLPIPNLRDLNWKRVLTEDPKIKVFPAEECGGLSSARPCIEVAQKGDDEGNIGGYANTEETLFGDVDGDGQDEAVILIDSGGTAGNVGLLVYGIREGKPTFSTALGGYKVVAGFAHDGKFYVSQPVYAGWEANCCFSGEEIIYYRLQGKQLVAVSREERGVEGARGFAIQHFYDLINKRNYREAYNLLSPAMQASQPYDVWAARFVNTNSIHVETSEQALVMRSGNPPQGDPVTFVLTVTERTTSGEMMTRRFAGTWSLTYSLEAHQWLLDRNEIREVK